METLEKTSRYFYIFFRNQNFKLVIKKSIMVKMLITLSRQEIFRCLSAGYIFAFEPGSFFRYCRMSARSDFSLQFRK